MSTTAQTLSSKVHDAILEMILEAGTDSEQLLLTEHGLVEKYGGSKAPVREALLRLCAEDVLRSIPRCGYVVVRVGEKSGRDNLAVRRMLELCALDQNFDRFTPERVAAIAARLDESRGLSGSDSSVWDIWQVNMDFHCGLIGAADNPYLESHLRTCIDVERRFYAQNHYNPDRPFRMNYSPEAHEGILDAIRRGDKAEALRLLDKDIGEGFLD